MLVYNITSDALSTLEVSARFAVPLLFSALQSSFPCYTAHACRLTVRAMSAAGRSDDAQANWYSQFDAQYDALLHLRDEQQQQQCQQQQKETNASPAILHSAQSVGPDKNVAPSSISAGAVSRQAAVLQQPPEQLRPQSSQSSQRRTRNGGSRRTNSDFPHMQQQQLQHKHSPSLLPVKARNNRSSDAQHSPNSASGQSIDSGVPAEFQDMMQQQMDSKRRVAQYKKHRAQEKAEQKAEEDARRADHRAKMKAIQLRSPASPAISASPSPVTTPHSSRPVSRQMRESDAVDAIEPAPASSFSSPSVRLAKRPPFTADRSRPQQPASLQSASIAPLSALTPTANHLGSQPTSHRHESSHHTPPSLLTAGQQPPLTAAPISTPSTDSPPAAPSSSVAPDTSRDSLRLLMRASRRQLQQQQQGRSEPEVEVRVGKPYTPRGSISSGLVRRASCEFDVVFASATASLASSPADTRRATIDKDTAVEWPQ